MNKFLTFVLTAAFFFAPNAAHADALTAGEFAYTMASDIWAIEFTPEGDEIYFAENGSVTGMRRATTANLLANGGAVATSADGLASFRTTQNGWQVADIEIPNVVGKNGHKWVYASGGNIEKPVSPTDAKGRTTGGVVWAIDRTLNTVESMTAKRSSGNWQWRGFKDMTATPDGRYIYVVGDPNGVDETAELYKFSTATNTQIGRGVVTQGFSYAADNTNVYAATGSGIYKTVIDGDNSQLNGDAVRSLMNITWSGTAFDYSKLNSISLLNSELYLASTDGTIGVVNPTTSTGTTYTISGVGSYPVSYGIRMGVDGCLYTVATNSAWNSYKLDRVDLRTSAVVASTGALANFRPRWEMSVSMNAAGTIYAASPKLIAAAKLYYLNTSGSTCGGISTYANGVTSSSSSSPAPTSTVEEIRREAEAKRAAEVAKAKDSISKKMASGTTLSASDLKEADFGTPSTASIVEINKVLEKLPVEQRQDINTVAAVVKKYVTYDVLTAERPSQITSSQLVNVGIMNKELPNKTVILKKILNTPVTDRDSIDEINQIIKNEGDKLLARKQRIAQLLTRTR
jgi:hypothetical protein